MSSPRTVVPTFAAALALTAFGCTPSGVPDSPDSTVEAVCKSLSANQPGIAWQALPPAYQSDVSGLVHDFAGKVDTQVYDKSFVVLGKLVKVLKTKKDYILAHPMLQTMPVNEKELQANWDSFVALLEVPLQSEINTVDGLKSLDIGEYLSDTGSELMEKLTAVSKAVPTAGDGKSFADQMASLANVQVEVVKSEGDNATVKITVPGQDPQEVEFAKVGGKWLPKDLVDGWDKAIADAKDGLAKMDPVKDKAKVMGVLGMADGALDSLLATSTAEEFNQQLNGLMGQVMGGMMGGGMPPGDGGAPPPRPGGVPGGAPGLPGAK